MAHPLSPPGSAGPGGPAATEPFQQLEAVMLRQMLQSSGAFHGTDSPGAQLRADLFVETLAEAVAKAGGLGIGRMLERQLAGGAGAAPAAPLHHLPSASLHHLPSTSPHVSGTPASSPATRTPMSHVSASPGLSPPMSQVSGTPDNLDDLNCDAPLPEDPSADSIDDYQPAPTAPTALARSGARPSFSASRALIRYRERAEVHGADHPSRASGGNEP